MVADFVILVVCGLAIILLGLAILIRNPNSTPNRWFAFLSSTMLIWVVFNYLSDHSNDHALLYTRLVFSAGILVAYSLIEFIANFPNSLGLRQSKWFVLFRAYTVALSVIVFSPSFISGITEDSIITSYLYPIFVVYVLLAFFSLSLLVRSQMKNAKTVSQRQQLTVISWGIVLYGLLALLFNVIFPLVASNWSSSRFGPAFSLLLIGFVAYSIVKHKLFDIRLALARSVAYIMLIGVVGAMYWVVIFALTSIFVNDEHISNTFRTLYLLVGLAVAFSFQRLKKLIEKISNKYLYRDAYDAQAFFDELNRSIVSNLSIDKLLTEVTNLMEQHLKVAGTSFLFHSSKNDARYFGPEELRMDESQLANIAKELELPNGVVVVDYLNDDSPIKELLREKNLAILVRLNTSTTKSRPDFLAISIKKSGNPYNNKDINVISILANELSVALQNVSRFEEIQKFNITLQLKIEEATRQLRRTNDKLKALDQTKDEFISMASHQLRTPLTSVKGYVSMVLEGDAGKITKQQRALLDQAFLSSQRMVYLIADLLNVSRLRTGKFVIESKPTQLADVIEGEIQQLQESAKAKNMKLTYHRPKAFPMLNLDETKIRQVIMNFADNALYYTPAGGIIDIYLEDKGQTIEFRVEDNGIGVPKNEQHHLFGKFYRAGNAQKARPDGTGLGLFMAKKVVVAQGGAILFRSQEGKGSMFGFTFPKKVLLSNLKTPV